MKNIKLRKIVVFTLALMVGISLLSACSKQDSSDVQEKSSAAVEKQASSDIEGQDSTDVQVQGSYDIKDDGNYVASGTIPASAKIYSVVDESFPMIITNNEDNLLDFEDIWIINHYVDLMASFNDTEGKGVQKDEISKFLTSYTVEDVMKNNEEAGVNYKLEGVQVLQIIVNDSNNIEAVYLERMTNESDTLSDTVASIRFKRTTDGHWLENGLSHVKTDKTGTFSVVWDDSIGKLSIKYPE